MVTTTKCLWSASRYDLTTGSRNINIGFVFLRCIFCLSFLFLSFTMVKTDSLHGVSADASHLFICRHIFNAGF